LILKIDFGQGGRWDNRELSTFGFSIFDFRLPKAFTAIGRPNTSFEFIFTVNFILISYINTGLAMPVPQEFKNIVLYLRNLKIAVIGSSCLNIFPEKV